MTTLVDAPARVDGVQLIGEMVGSGYKKPPALVRRADGQVLQLTPLLFLVLSAVDGQRSYAEIAERVGRALGRGVTGDDVETLVDRHLRPLCLVRGVDGSEAELKRSDPLLGLKFRIAVTSPRATRLITDPFRILFRPLVTTVVVIGFVAVVGWVFFERGLGASAYDAFERPQLLLLVFAVSVLSGGFHEFGHAAAARYGGAQPGRMGAGLYLVWPAFYTDVTDSYRLGRGGRIRTDLGGLYFNGIVIVLTFVWWWSTGWEALLLLVATQVLQMMQQLLPLLRFDGYHLLADIAGVPDLYHRIKPTLLGLLPHRWRSPENTVLKPSARLVITLWVLITVPMMALMLFALVAAVPRLIGSAVSAMGEDTGAVGQAWRDGSILDVAGHSLQVLAVVLPALACALILGRVGYRSFSGLARWGQGSWVRRTVAAAVAACMVTGLAWAWWPHPGTYRPIEPGEKGTLSALLQDPGDGADLQHAAARAPALPLGSAAEERLSSGEPLVATFQEGQELPTRQQPRLAMVLVPSGPGGGDGGDDGASSPDGTWVFPFDRPLPPSEGDNQALAVATADGSVTYDVAFALVWATGNEVLNVNEAHAYASCSDCVAVAVAFQVVLIMDDANVVIPQNLAVAANYDCYRCITAAIASQLVLSVGTEPGEEQLLALSEVWSRLTQFARSITSYSLLEISAQLEAFKSEITAILHGGPLGGQTGLSSPAASSTAAAVSATPSPTAGSASSSASPNAAQSTAPPASTEAVTSSPSASPTATAPRPASSSTSTSSDATTSEGAASPAGDASP